MAVIWGLDLKEMQWGKFKSSYMFGNKDYYRRRTRFIVYQLAMILCVISESLGTSALSNYTDQQNRIKDLDHRATVYNNDYVGVASYNIFVGIFVATVFGAGFFFDLFWPERTEDRGIRIAWKGCAVFASLLALGSVIAETIIVSSKEAYVSGVDAGRAEELLRMYDGSPLVYRKNARALASLVFLWVGFPFVVWSTVLMWMSISHNEKWGPFHSHVEGMRKRKTLPTASDEELGDTLRMERELKRPTPEEEQGPVVPPAEQGPVVPPAEQAQAADLQVPAETHKGETVQAQ